MRKILVLLSAACAASPAFADWSGKDATGATITFKNPNVCTSVVCVPISSLVDATGAAVGTAGAPLRIDPTGTTTQPMSAAALPLPAGASTSANQTTEITALNSIVTNTAAPLPAGGSVVGYTSNDPCTQATKVNVAIATSAGTFQAVVPSGVTQVYVCSFSLVAAAAAVVNLVGGTGATCTTGTPVALMGSTTPASGMSLAANGGLTFGNGGATVTRTTTGGHGVCLIQSGVIALAGSITYVQQ
jgi:hypothetical protein